MGARAVQGADPRSGSDAGRIRALTHPVRLALLDALSLNSELTATEAGELIGETATTCSFHLRQLARYGFVVSAAEPGRRDRPWRLVEPDITLARSSEGPAAFLGAGLESLVHGRAVERWEAWRRQATEFPSVWRDVSPFRNWLLHMTPAEMAELDQRLHEFLHPIAARAVPPDDAVAVQVVAYGHPLADQTTRGD